MRREGERKEGYERRLARIRGAERERKERNDKEKKAKRERDKKGWRRWRKKKKMELKTQVLKKRINNHIVNPERTQRDENKRRKKAEEKTKQMKGNRR